MITISSISLAGGQGKSTTTLFLARFLASFGFNVLVIDADPQSSLTTFLSCQVESTQPTLLEVLKKEVTVKDGIYETKYPNLYVIPSDDALDQVQEYLSNSGTGALALKRRLAKVESLFDYTLIDSPPQRSQISLTTIGAADALIIPVEVSVKGLKSLQRTLSLIMELKDDDQSFGGQILGILPFRDRWVGRYQTKESKSNIDSMKLISSRFLNTNLLLPTIRESEQYKSAMNQGLSLYELGESDLAFPIEVLGEISQRLREDRLSIIDENVISHIKALINTQKVQLPVITTV
jgi:chromosome partitioning protein